ncbi:MAG: hypothetical protein LBB23_03985 [Rickettsiales bacterium]|jgi:hypothetical protein|nr:hypothetical protein [Rickettsiales bacterium]
MKRSVRARAIWFPSIVVAVAAVAALLFPAFSDFSYIKAGMANALSARSGAEVSINGSVKIALLPRPVLRAHEVVAKTTDYQISANALQFPISIENILAPAAAAVPSEITIRGGTLLTNDRKFTEINGRATLAGKSFSGSFEHAGRKFIASISDGAAKIENPNLALRAEFKFDANGCEGTFKGSFQNLETFLNEWGYSFSEVAKRPWAITTEFNLDRAGLNLKNMTLASADTILSGRATFPKNDVQTLDLVMADGNLGILEIPDLTDKNINIIGSGKFDFRGRTAKKFDISMAGGILKRADILGDDWNIHASGSFKGGKAENLDLSLFEKDGRAIAGISAPASVRCILTTSGENWECSSLSISGESFSMSGAAEMQGGQMNLKLDRINGMEINDIIKSATDRFQNDIKITFPGGQFGIGNSSKTYANDKAKLKDIPFKSSITDLIPPALVQKIKGKISAESRSGFESFAFDSDNLKIAITDNNGAIQFAASGRDFAGIFGDVFPGAGGKFLKPDLPFDISGNFSGGDFDDIKINIAGQEFTGRGADGRISLNGKTLNIDDLKSPDWNINFEQLQFVSQDPMLSMFRITPDFSLATARVISGGATYQDLAYSKIGTAQKASLTDGSTGVGVWEITRRGGSEYEINVKISGFKIPGLFANLPGLNVEGATLTAEAWLTTMGLTANDVRQNLAGSAELNFDGGKVVGIDTRRVFAAPISHGNAFDVVSSAFAKDASMPIRTLNVPLRISGGSALSSAPMNIRSDTSNISGFIKSDSEGTAAKLSVVFKNGAAEPRPLEVRVAPSGASFDREELFRSVDPDYIKSIK